MMVVMVSDGVKLYVMSSMMCLYDVCQFMTILYKKTYFCILLDTYITETAYSKLIIITNHVLRFLVMHVRANNNAAMCSAMNMHI